MSKTTKDYRESLFEQVSNIPSQISRNALNILKSRVGGLSLKIGKSIILQRNELVKFSPEQRAWMQRAGEVIRDSRETAGLTLDDMRDALKVEDRNLLEAMEQGSATLSFEMILRLTSLLARNDPVPFLVSLLRGFNPELWALLEDWGFGHLPTMVERDRRWLNIYRSSEQARQLPDAHFDRLIDFNTASFKLAMTSITEPLPEVKPRRSRSKSSSTEGSNNAS